MIKPSCCQSRQRDTANQPAEEHRSYTTPWDTIPQIRDFELDVAAQRVYLSPRQPFDFLAEVAVIAARLAGPDGAIPSGHSVWLAFLDAYRTKCVAPQSAFRRVLDELVRLEAV